MLSDQEVRRLLELISESVIQLDGGPLLVGVETYPEFSDEEDIVLKVDWTDEWVMETEIFYLSGFRTAEVVGNRITLRHPLGVTSTIDLWKLLPQSAELEAGE